MKIICVANQKGGIGKSTLITVLAGALAADYGYRVLVVDADSQQTLAGVRLTNDQPSVELEREAGTLTEPAFPYALESVGMAQVYDRLDEISDDYDVVFIDVPGRSDDTAMIDVLSGANVVLVPVGASDAERLATISFMQLLQEISRLAKEQGLDFQFFGVHSHRTNLKEEKDMDEFTDALGLPRLQASLRQLGCYKRLSTRYSYLNPAYRRAVGADATVEAEVRALCDELIARAGLTAELVS